jgi:hypothetical protein
MKASRIALAALALCSGAAFAGTAEVRFVNPEKFADIGTFKSDEQPNMDTLSHYIGQLARQLPADQTLRVDVIDVDLAGDVRQTRNGPLRVARESGFPVIELRWSLESGGHVLRSGEARLTDLNYRHHLKRAGYSTTSLYYEKYMLEEWFRREFAPGVQAYAR